MLKMLEIMYRFKSKLLLIPLEIDQLVLVVEYQVIGLYRLEQVAVLLIEDSYLLLMRLAQS
jgi:hypothetical protein